MNDSSLLVHLPNHLCGGRKKHANVRGPYVHENFDGDRSGGFGKKARFRSLRTEFGCFFRACLARCELIALNALFIKAYYNTSKDPL